MSVITNITNEEKYKGWEHFYKPSLFSFVLRTFSMRWFEARRQKSCFACHQDLLKTFFTEGFPQAEQRACSPATSRSLTYKVTGSEFLPGGPLSPFNMKQCAVWGPVSFKPQREPKVQSVKDCVCAAGS